MRKYWKRLMVLILAFCLTLTACGGSSKEETVKVQGSVETEQTTQESEPETTTAASVEETGGSGISPEELIADGFGIYHDQSIEWMVLHVDSDNQKALLITNEVIDNVPIHDGTYGEDVDLTWETCSLREYLNGEFYETVFSDEQKTRILETVNQTEANSEFGTSGGNDTTDRVFLLSEQEACLYFEDDASMSAMLNGETASWWTRTPGDSNAGFVCTYSDGGLYLTGNSADFTTLCGLRPAVWVDLSNE